MSFYIIQLWLMHHLQNIIFDERGNTVIRVFARFFFWKILLIKVFLEKNCLLPIFICKFLLFLSINRKAKCFQFLMKRENFSWHKAQIGVKLFDITGLSCTLMGRCKSRKYLCKAKLYIVRWTIETQSFFVLSFYKKKSGFIRWIKAKPKLSR